MLRMSYRKLYFLIINLVLLSSLHSYAQLGGGTSFTFLRLPSSAKITALGGYSSIAADAELANVTQNPSLLNNRMDNIWSLNICNYFK